MAVEQVPPSPAVLAVYQQSLDDYFGPHEPEVQLYHLPVGTLAMNQLANGATLNDVLASGCRFFAVWTNGNVTSCEMTQPSQYGKAKFRNIVNGDPVRVPFQRILESHGLDEVQTADFELHFLSIPAIHFEGIHLVSKDGASDILLPVLSFEPALATDAVLTTEAFLSKVRRIATARLKSAAKSEFSS